MLDYKVVLFLISLISQWHGVDSNTYSGPCEGNRPYFAKVACQPVQHRFYYSSLSETCKYFQFQNCSGSFYGNILNNFPRLEECQNTCLRKDPSVILPPDNSNCTLPSDMGFIASNNTRSPFPLTRYFYNATLGTCLQFYYIGEGGNANNFVTKDQCNRVCYPGSPPNSTTYMLSSSSSTAYVSSSSSGYFDTTTSASTVQTLSSSSEMTTSITVTSDMTDTYHQTFFPSSTRQNSKKFSTVVVVSETSLTKPINVYLYASVGVIVVIVVFLVMASTVLIGMYICFKKAIVSDAYHVEAVAPSTSSAPWQPHPYLAVIRGNKSQNDVPCSPVSDSSPPSVDN